MATYLVKTQEIYRVSTDAEANTLINEAKEDPGYTLTKYNCQSKETKSKGEVIDEWYQVTLCKAFTEEKEPDRKVHINYTEEEPNYGTF